MTSPEKTLVLQRREGEKAKRVLQLERGMEVVAAGGEKVSEGNVGALTEGDKNSSMQAMHVDQKDSKGKDKEVAEGNLKEKKADGRKKGTFKRLSRARDEQVPAKLVKESAKKRNSEDAEMEDGGVAEEEEKGEAATNKRVKKAGLANRSCEAQ